MARRPTGRLTSAAILIALTMAVSPSAITPPRIAFTETRLSNGLRLIVAEDHIAPVFSIAVIYNVGSRDERHGRTGFAHLFEHMMFKGSENVGPGEHFYTVFSNGGTMNGTTNKERTLYFETMPANQLEAGLFLEADRMRSLAIVKDNLDNQRQAVQEERRQGLDNQPYGRTNEAVDQLAFDNPAYKHSVIGSMEDLNAASVDDVATFFKTYYAPNNAVLSLVGDFKPSEALAQIKHYFEDIPRQPEPPAVDLAEPEQQAERRETMTDALARATQIQIAYKTPVGNAPDVYALRVLSSVLQSGDSSRLYQLLNKEKELVVSVGGFVDERIGPGGLYIGATVRPGKKADDVEAAIYAEIEKLQQQPIAEWELEKAKNTTRYGYLQSIRSAQSRATQLGVFTVKFNDPGLINSRVTGFEAVTRADVQRVAKKYLLAKSRTVIVTNPAPPPAAAPGA